MDGLHSRGGVEKEVPKNLFETNNNPCLAGGSSDELFLTKLKLIHTDSLFVFIISFPFYIQHTTYVYIFHSSLIGNLILKQ